jgi:magnesium transporter
MSTTTETTPWETLLALTDRNDAEALRQFADALGTRECAWALSRLGAEDQARVITLLGPEHAAALMEDLSHTQAAQLIENLETAEAAPILEEMESAQAADVLTQLDDAHIEELLSAMEPEAAQDARMLTQYDAHVAGGLMITEYLAYPDSYTVRQVVEEMREQSDKYRRYSVQYVYVITPEGTLVGVLPLRDLLLAPPDQPIAEIMIRNPLCVEDDDTFEQLAALFQDYDFLGVPVIDHGGHLIGVVRRTDIIEAAGERAQSDFLKTQGIVSGEEIRSMPLVTRSKRRLSWLSANILLNIISASVIGFYEETLAAVIALAVFLPIISDMSGNCGAQSVAVTMRELTLGLIKPREVVRVCLDELKLGLMNGAVLGVLLALAAFLWKGNPFLGLVVGGAMALNTIVAVLFGGTIPLLLKGLKQDPALASGPILTTVTDMCGFFLVLSFAAALLPYLT